MHCWLSRFCIERVIEERPVCSGGYPGQGYGAGWTGGPNAAPNQAPGGWGGYGPAQGANYGGPGYGELHARLSPYIYFFFFPFTIRG